MKIVTKVLRQKVTRYVADDGIVFTTEADCKAYERKLARADLKAKLDQIERCVAADGLTPLDGCEYMEEHDYTWYRPKTREEATVLYKWYELDNELEDSDIGEWVCIEQTYDGAVWCFTMDCSISHVYDFFKRFGYDVTITKEDENV